MIDLKQNFNFSLATLIKPFFSQKLRRLLKYSVISKTKRIKQRPGFFQISSYIMLH